MGLLFTISIRNLLRQKRRNILLGIAIAFGTMILVLSNAFSAGISDVIFNKIVSYVSGHVSVAFSENGNAMKSIFRDGDRIKAIVKETVPDIIQLQEAIGVYTRAIGNGAADNVVMVGMDLDAYLTAEGAEKAMREAEQNFKMIEGTFNSIKDTNIENAVLISIEKAKTLKVKKGDVLRVRYIDMNGQNQAARLTVAGLFKPANMFMSVPVFLEIETLKKLLGYGPHDIAQLYINVRNPRRDAIRYADSIYARLHPDVAVISGTGGGKLASAAVNVLGFKGDSTTRSLLFSAMRLAPGDSAAALGKQGVCISAVMAQSLDLGAGDTLRVSYLSKYGTDSVRTHFVVTTVFAPVAGVDPYTVLVRDHLFIKAYYAAWPATSAWHPDSTHPLFPALSTEWILLKRAKNTQEMMKQFRTVAKLKQRGGAVDVRTMYESASDVLKLEVALNLITLVAVMVLFFIILIGVINTLRMTIRERTREIGTVRAIGMQRGDVRNSFILETSLLALFSALAGTLFAFITMGVLSSITIDPGDNPMGMILANGHLNFVPTVVSVIGNILLIIAIATITAFFPARRAAKLSAAAALRHYE